MATTGFNGKQLMNNYQQAGFDIKNIGKILWYRRLLVVGVSCVVMSATSLLAVMTKPMYQSSMQIMVKDNLDQELSLQTLQALTKNELRNPQISSRPYNYQMKLMVSSKLVQKAVDLLHSDYPQITIEDIKGNSNTGRYAPLKIRRLEESSTANGVYSQVFIVSFKDPDPIKTKRVLQALQKVYQVYNLAQKKQRIDQGLAFVKSGLPNLKRQTLAAEKRLELFRKKYNFINPELQSKILLESLADIQKERRNYRSQLEKVDSRYNSLRQKLVAAQKQIKLSNNLNNSEKYEKLVDQIQKTQSRLTQENLRYTDNSPVIIKLKEELKVQRALLEKELKNKNSSKSRKALNDKNNLDNQLKALINQRNAIINNDKKLAESEKEIRSKIKSYPALITEYNRLVSDAKTQKQAFERMAKVKQSLGLKIAQSGFDLQILEDPDLGIYIGNRKWLLIISGVIIGPLSGVILALLWEMCNQVIVTPRDFKKLANINFIGSVPKFKRSIFSDSIKSKFANLLTKKQNKEASINSDVNPKLSSHENLDMIYQNIQIFKNSLPFKSLTVTSSVPGEGKTTVALGLGMSAANMRQRVLLIDANLRAPSLHQILGLSNDWGLSLLLLDDIKVQFENYIQPIHPSIDVLTAGPKADDTVNLLCSGRLKELIESFEAIYDLAIIDTSSILDTVDARIIASVSNGIVMVGKVGQLTPHNFLQTTEILSQLNLIGIIANEVNNSEIREFSER